MNFDSVFFLSCFLPVVAVLYWVVPGLRGKNILLLVFSLVFYSFSGLASLLMLVALALVNYLLSLLIRAGRAAKAATAAPLMSAGAVRCFRALSRAEMAHRPSSRVNRTFWWKG